MVHDVQSLASLGDGTRHAVQQAIDGRGGGGGGGIPLHATSLTSLLLNLGKHFHYVTIDLVSKHQLILMGVKYKYKYV